jgi:hypothetical protein
VLAVRLRGSSALVNAACVTFAAFCVLPISLTVRPQLWSALGLALLVPLVQRIRPTRWSAIGVVCLFVVWANLHGGWITGLAVLGTYAVVRLARAPKDGSAWFALVAAGAAATLVNPYGVGLWRFLAGTVRPARPDIFEWQPLSLALPWTHWVPAVGPLIITVLLSLRRTTRPPLEAWAIIALLTASAVRVMRVGPLVAPAELILLAPYIRVGWGRIGHIRIADRGIAAVMWVPVVVTLAAAVRPTASALRCIRVEGLGSPDLEAAAMLKGTDGRLWVAFDWGEYALWHFGPRLKVSIDGRRETLYSDAVIQLHRDVERGDPRALGFVASPSIPTSYGCRQRMARRGHGSRITGIASRLTRGVHSSRSAPSARGFRRVLLRCSPVSRESRRSPLGLVRFRRTGRPCA